MRLKKVTIILLLIVAALLLLSSTVPVAAEEPTIHLVLGGNGAANWEIGPILPGQSGTKTVTVQNSGSQQGNLSIWFTNIINLDGTPNEFETHTPGDLGELGSFLKFSLSASRINTDVEFPATIDDLPHDAADSRYIRAWPLEAQETITLNWEWNLPPDTDDIVQGDTLSFDINYALEELIPAPPAGGTGGGGGAGPISGVNPKPGSSRFIEIDILGEKASREISEDNRLVESYVGKTTDGSIALSFTKGTAILSNAKEAPSRIAVAIYPQFIPAGENEKIIGNIYSIEVYDVTGNRLSATFSPPFLITEIYDPQSLPADVKSIYLNYYDQVNKKWSLLELPPAYTENPGRLAAMIDKVLLYTAVANVNEAVVPVLTPARIEVKNLTVSPGNLQLGQNVVIRGEAVNTGKLPGEGIIELNVPGLLQDSLSVKLAPGQRQEIKYSLTPSSVGEYEVLLGDAKGKFTVVTAAPQGIYKAFNLLSLPPVEKDSIWWWMVLLIVVVLILVIVFALEKRRRRSLLAPALEIVTELTHRLSQRKSQIPVVEGVTGPIHRIKGPGPFKYSVKITGGKAPYSVEWKGNRIICSGTNCEDVEILDSQTWDSGKGNWVFFTVKDSTGKYAQWIDDKGEPRRLFTYGITYRNAVVTDPATFPYKIPTRTKVNAPGNTRIQPVKNVKFVPKESYNRVSAERVKANKSKVIARKSATKGQEVL